MIAVTTRRGLPGEERAVSAIRVTPGDFGDAIGHDAPIALSSGRFFGATATVGVSGGVDVAWNEITGTGRAYVARRVVGADGVLGSVSEISDLVKPKSVGIARPSDTSGAVAFAALPAATSMEANAFVQLLGCAP